MNGEEASLYGVLEEESLVGNDNNNIPLRPKLAIKRVNDTQLNLYKLLGIYLILTIFFFYISVSIFHTLPRKDVVTLIIPLIGMGNCGFAMLGLIATVLLDKLIIRLYIGIQIAQICLLGLPIVFIGIIVLVGLIVVLNPYYFTFYALVLELVGISSLAIFFLSILTTMMFISLLSQINEAKKLTSLVSTNIQYSTFQ